MYPLPELTTPPQHPVEYLNSVGDFLFRTVNLQDAGAILGQHKHEHDHVTLVTSGAGRLWVNGEHVGDYPAFSAVEVKAGNLHIWQALLPDTRVTCLFHEQSMKGI